MGASTNTFEGPEWHLAFDLDREQVSEAHLAAEARGLGIIDISGWWDGQERFAGLWTLAGASSGEGTSMWYRGIDVDEYRQAVAPNDEGDAGFRPIRQSFYTTPEGLRLASVWHDRPTRWMSKYGLSAEEFNLADESAKSAGLAIIDLVPYEEDGEARYAAVWEAPQSAHQSEAVVFLEQQPSEFLNNFSRLVQERYVPRRVAGLHAERGLTYASVWEKQGQDCKPVRRRDDVPVKRFDETLSDLVKAGYWPTQISGYSTQFGARLGAMFENQEGRVAALYGADTAEMREYADQERARDFDKRANLAEEERKRIAAEERRRARREAEERRLAESYRRSEEEKAEARRQQELEERSRQEAAAAQAAAAEAQRAATARPTEKVRAALDTALAPLNDIVDGAVMALVIAAAGRSSQDISSPEKLAAFMNSHDVTRIRNEVVGAVQSRGAAEFHYHALKIQDAWQLKAGPLQLDLEGTITLLEISARAQYDVERLSAAAFFDSISARISGSAGVGIDGLGKAWAGGSLTGPGASGGAFVGLDGVGGQIGVTYGRAEAAAGLNLLGQQTQVGIGVSAGFELGLQLSATVSVKLGPLAASIPNVPLAAVTWAAGALADVLRNPEKTVVNAVEDVAGAVGDVVGFFGDMAAGVVDLGESVIEGVGDIIGARDEVDIPIATKAETAADGRKVKHLEKFEGHNRAWIVVGNAGISENVAWLRTTQNVCVVAGFFDVMRSVPYTLTITARTSTSPVVALVGVRDAPSLDAKGAVIQEMLLPAQAPEFKRYVLKFTSTASGRVLVYIGVAGNGTDAWCQIDTVHLDTKSVYID